MILQINKKDVMCNGIKYFLLVYFCFWMPVVLTAQNPVTLTILQDVDFGTFAVLGNGGTITVSSDGVRSATGEVVLIGNDYNAGLFRVEVPPGTYLNLTSGIPVALTGNQGGQMDMELDETYPSFPFNTIAPFHDFQYGATLKVGPSGITPSGGYNGSFELILSYD